MHEILPTLVVMRRELQLLTKAVAQISTLQSQQLSEYWFRKQQLLKLLGISTRTLDRLTSSGKLKFSKINGLIFIKKSDVELMLNEHYDNHSSTINPKFND